MFCLEVIIKTLPHVNLPLVVLGRKTKYYSKTILPLIQKLKVENKVIFLEDLSLKKLPLLYQGSSCFIYPSKFEGFGIPVLEALYCKVPVITSNSSSLKEVALFECFLKKTKALSTLSSLPATVVILSHVTPH